MYRNRGGCNISRDSTRYIIGEINFRIRYRSCVIFMREFANTGFGMRRVAAGNDSRDAVYVLPRSVFLSGPTIAIYILNSTGCRASATIVKSKRQNAHRFPLCTRPPTYARSRIRKLASPSPSLSLKNRENRSSRPPRLINRVPSVFLVRKFLLILLSLSLYNHFPLRCCKSILMKRKEKEVSIKRILFSISFTLRFLRFSFFFPASPFQLSLSFPRFPPLFVSLSLLVPSSFRADLKVDRHALRSRGQKWERRKGEEGGKEKRRTEEVRSG